MILREELEKIARTNKKSLYHLEKSYLQTIVLQAIYSKTEIIFKGGTALMMFAHLPRFSEDLDFTSLKAETTPISKLSKIIQNELANYGIFSNIDNIKETDISSSFRIGAKGPLYESEKSTSYLKIEISFREKVILSAKKEYFQPIFPDILPFFISFMDLQEILAEKIRAVMSRTRARDIFDLWFLLIKGVKFNLKLVQSKLNYYNIQWDLNKFLECLNFSQKKWKRIIQPIVWQKIPPFNQISNQISEIIKNHL
ncbi:MAG: nucleotidyl transferase AbiEii/AbiGii toxin family protein [Candidatus Lokiarchaeota archaeon]|nr:nucleotidyl transferase AbiEii/AbiGii toxin family protein [Candidatus Harpocratesius repetitus]